VTPWFRLATIVVLVGWASRAGSTADGAEEPVARSTAVVSLDAPDWLVAPDPKNVGRQEQWWLQPRPQANPVRVPGVFQEALLGYHGVAWYWRDFAAPANPHAQGRYLLRFWMVDYLADVWLNGVHVGHHEGGEEMFVLDVTNAVKAGAVNRLAVRVLNPTNEAIDGMSLGDTPHRNRSVPLAVGNGYNGGGIVDSVELLVTPATRVENLLVRPDCKTGEIHVQANVRNALQQPVTGHLLFTVAPAAAGETLHCVTVDSSLPPGDTLVKTRLKINNPHPWNLDDPCLYRVTACVKTDGSASFDETSTRCGFRDFRFDSGCFRLNGKRIFLRASHSGNEAPVGYRVPLDPDLLRRDLLNSKVMGFNMIRFFCQIPRRYQVDLCDEIGFLVYEESLAGWVLGDTPQMPERFNTSIRGMIQRDRNHPSVVLWGLLNENFGDGVFHYAVSTLPWIRTLDDTRVVLLNSGRLDKHVFAWPPECKYLYGDNKLPAVWYTKPWIGLSVAHNGLQEPVTLFDSTWAAGQLSLCPGNRGQYSVARWTAPESGKYTISAVFTGIARETTTDLHVFLNDASVFDGVLNLNGRPNTAKFQKTLAVNNGDQINVVVGWGNGLPRSNTTALAMTIKSPQGNIYDVAADFTTKSNPNGVWSYGWLASGAKPDLATFMLYADSDTETPKPIGSLSNPGSTTWQEVLADHHCYRHVPHRIQEIQEFRDRSPKQPVFISEYGICSAVDLVRQARHYEQIGHTASEDARLYRGLLEKFMVDWDRLKMADTFANPEDYFRQCVAKMAAQRLLGLNIIRANPRCVGHSMTGTYDHGFVGEGATASEFRELKPGATDAIFDGFAPLRFCLFVEPVNVYCGRKVRLEAVLANEDALPPGEYPVRLQVVGPTGISIYDKMTAVKIADPKSKPEPALAIPIFDENIVIDGPTGKYRFFAAFQKGGAAAGGNVEFYATNAADMPRVETDVAIWGDEPALTKWATEHGIKTHPLSAGKQSVREVILVGGTSPAGDAAAWRELARHIARGSTAVFLVPDAFKKGDNPTGWLPLANKGTLASNGDWLYPHDQWTKKHPIFDGLPCGGLMDYTFYRDTISECRWSGQDAPAEIVAASVNTSAGYDAGTLIAVYNLGAGRFILNAFLIRDNMGRDPVAERLLRNLLRYASCDAAQPLAELPASFEAQLKAMGY
jgi:hypothetical protein